MSIRSTGASDNWCQPCLLPLSWEMFQPPFQHYFFPLLDPQPWSDSMCDYPLHVPHSTCNTIQPLCTCSCDVPAQKALLQGPGQALTLWEAFHNPPKLLITFSPARPHCTRSVHMVSVASLVSFVYMSPPQLDSRLLKGRDLPLPQWCPMPNE